MSRSFLKTSPHRIFTQRHHSRSHSLYSLARRGILYVYEFNPGSGRTERLKGMVSKTCAASTGAKRFAQRSMSRINSLRCRSGPSHRRSPRARAAHLSSPSIIHTHKKAYRHALGPARVAAFTIMVEDSPTSKKIVD